MANRRAIVKRRKAVRNTKKITRTMQLIATARFQAAMNRAVAVVTRDAPSTALLAEMRVHSKVLEATDVAMRLPHANTAPRRNEKTRVGLNVSGLLMSGGYTGANQFGLSIDYPALIREIIRFFQAQDFILIALRRKTVKP